MENKPKEGEEGEEEQCGICLTEGRDGYFSCGHCFHGKCIEKQTGVEGKCPLCPDSMGDREIVKLE